MSDVRVTDLTGHSEKKDNGKKITSDVFVTYACALLTIAGADGEISPSEKNYLMNKLIGLGANDEVINEVKNFDWENANLEALTSELQDANLPGNWAGALLYDAIKVARADEDYALDEKKAIQTTAKRLGLDDNITFAINGVVEMESLAARILRSLLGCG